MAQISPSHTASREAKLFLETWDELYGTDSEFIHSSKELSGAISICTSSFEGFPLTLLPSVIDGTGKVRVVELRADPKNLSSCKGRPEH